MKDINRLQIALVKKQEVNDSLFQKDTSIV